MMSKSKNVVLHHLMQFLWTFWTPWLMMKTDKLQLEEWCYRFIISYFIWWKKKCKRLIIEKRMPFGTQIIPALSAVKIWMSQHHYNTIMTRTSIVVLMPFEIYVGCRYDIGQLYHLSDLMLFNDNCLVPWIYKNHKVHMTWVLHWEWLL